jgi:hypothetical protein
VVLDGDLGGWGIEILEGCVLFGFEEAEHFEVAMIFAIYGVHAALEAGEVMAAADVGFAEERILRRTRNAIDGVSEELDFDFAEAAGEPFAASEFVAISTGLGGMGRVVVVVLGNEGCQFGRILAGEDHGLSMKAGLQGIHGGAGATGFGARSGGAARIAAVGIDLFLRGHGYLLERAGNKKAPRPWPRGG